METPVGPAPLPETAHPRTTDPERALIGNAHLEHPLEPAMPRPLLFLDVDGPLNPFRAEHADLSDSYVAHPMRPTGWEPPARPLRVRLNPKHGEALLALPYDLVWATTWEEDANTMIGPLLGLPELPVVAFPHVDRFAPGLFFKTRRLVEYAAGRPFAWVDDGITARDITWVRRNHLSDALLHPVDPAIGLWEKDFELLADWPEDMGLVD